MSTFAVFTVRIFLQKGLFGQYRFLYTTATNGPLTRKNYQYMALKALLVRTQLNDNQEKVRNRTYYCTKMSCNLIKIFMLLLVTTCSAIYCVTEPKPDKTVKFV